MLPPYTHPSQDRPIHRPEHDKLNRGPFVESLARALVRDERDDRDNLLGRQATGFVVGLTGKWGLGKSSVLHLLALELGSMDRVIVSLFNPWLFNGRDELLRGFFSGLRDAMGRSNVEHARDLAEALDRYWGAIDIAGHAVAAIVDAYGGAGVATSGWKFWGKKAKAALPKTADLSPEVERKALEKKLANQKVAVVVLIDELDRVEDSEVRAVAQLVKAVGEIEGLSYLVAYDADRVTDALGRGEGDIRKTSGAHYLEKIIQLPIPLRPLFSEDVEALLRLELGHHGVVLPEDLGENEREVFEQIKREVSTPRDIKRLIGAYAVLSLATRGEISDIDVLAYSWITVKAPGLRGALANDPDKVVVDPGTDEMIIRMTLRDESKEPPNPADILGTAAAKHAELLRLMFPRFSKRQSSDERDSTRLRHRRNLVRLLYLGNPPGAVSRAELEAVWSLPDMVAMEANLRELLAAGTLPTFLDRLDDLIADLPPSGDIIFWPALSKVLTRSEDWISGPYPEHAPSRDAIDTLMRLGIRDQRQIERVESAMEALIAAGDLVIAPGVVRKHMFAHGLTHHGPSQGAKVAYTTKETQALLKRELPRYRDAIMDGIALRRLPNVEAIYVISNHDSWDADLRENFTEQLQGRASLTAAAALLVPPGYGADLPTFERLFDTTRVKERITALGEFVPPLDPWLASAFRQFRGIIFGKNPHFPDDEDDDDLLAKPSQETGLPMTS